MSFCVYIHINNINGKVYIGQTCQKPESRWNHGEGYKTSPHFYKAIQKYSWNNFSHQVLFDNLTAEEANKLEQQYIQLFDSTNPNKGYNLQPGGQNGLHSQETKEKIRQNQLGEKNSFYGKKHSEETKEKIGLSQMGNKHHAAKQVQCIETKQIFDTLTEASIWLKGDSNFRGKISEVCRGKRKSAGKHPLTAEPLHWRYIE